MTSKPSKEFEKSDKAMDKIMSVSKQELDRRLDAAKKAKTGKRYPMPKEPKATSQNATVVLPVSCL
jgi:hypothetical protein